MTATPAYLRPNPSPSKTHEFTHCRYQSASFMSSPMPYRAFRDPIVSHPKLRPSPMITKRAASSIILRSARIDVFPNQASPHIPLDAHHRATGRKACPRFGSPLHGPIRKQLDRARRGRKKRQSQCPLPRWGIGIPCNHNPGSSSPSRARRSDDLWRDAPRQGHVRPFFPAWHGMHYPNEIERHRFDTARCILRNRYKADRQWQQFPAHLA